MFTCTTDAFAENERAVGCQDACAAAAPLAQPQAAAPLAAAPATPGLPLAPVMGVASGTPPAASRGRSPPPPPPAGSASPDAMEPLLPPMPNRAMPPRGGSGALREDHPIVRTRHGGAGPILGCQCGAPRCRRGARRSRVRGPYCRCWQAGLRLASGRPWRSCPQHATGCCAHRCTRSGPRWKGHQNATPWPMRGPSGSLRGHGPPRGPSGSLGPARPLDSPGQWGAGANPGAALGPSVAARRTQHLRCPPDLRQDSQWRASRPAGVLRDRKVSHPPWACQWLQNLCGRSSARSHQWRSSARSGSRTTRT